MIVTTPPAIVDGDFHMLMHDYQKAMAASLGFDTISAASAPGIPIRKEDEPHRLPPMEPNPTPDDLRRHLEFQGQRHIDIRARRRENERSTGRIGGGRKQFRWSPRRG